MHGYSCYITTKGALTSLNISKNGLLNKQGGKVLGDMLKANSVLKELDVSGSGEGMHGSQKDAPGFAKELAAGLSTNGALASLDLSQNSVPESEAEQIKTACQSKEISLKI